MEPPLSRRLDRICVFCGSSPGGDPAFAQAAATLGASLARSGRGLVYGGGATGLMGTLANAALAAGGAVIGVIPERLAAREVAHLGLTQLHVVPTMHARKALMVELADAFVALPGGFGTLDELFEVVTWSQLGIHAKPIGLLNVNGYFDALLRFVEHAAASGLIREAHGGLLLVAEDADELLARLPTHVVPPLSKWATPPQP